MLKEIEYTRFPRVQIWRRGVAFSIDFVGVWLLSTLLSGNRPGFQVAQVVVFISAWWGMRVLLVYKNQGQSLGQWALNMKVLDARFSRIPGLEALSKREAVTGFGAILVALTLSNLTTNVGIVLLVIPLAIDCSTALSDTIRRQAIHDRFANTIVISTRRGYSLDIKFKRLFAQVRRNVRK